MIYSAMLKKVNGFTVKTKRDKNVKFHPFLFCLVEKKKKRISSHNTGILNHDEQNEFVKYFKIHRQACLASQFKSPLYFHCNLTQILTCFF